MKTKTDLDQEKEKKKKRKKIKSCISGRLFHLFLYFNAEINLFRIRGHKLQGNNIAINITCDNKTHEEKID